MGGSLAILVYLVGAYAWGGKRAISKALGKKTKPKEVVKPKGVKPPKKNCQVNQLQHRHLYRNQVVEVREEWLQIIKQYLKIITQEIMEI